MSETYSIIILPEAQDDMRKIILYIAGELSAPQAALALQNEFKETINSLGFMPERIKTVEEQPWRDAGIRKIKVKNYYVYFIVDDEAMTVKVMAVIYTGKDQKRDLRKL